MGPARAPVTGTGARGQWPSTSPRPAPNRPPECPSLMVKRGNHRTLGLQGTALPLLRAPVGTGHRHTGPLPPTARTRIQERCQGTHDRETSLSITPHPHTAGLCFCPHSCITPHPAGGRLLLRVAAGVHWHRANSGRLPLHRDLAAVSLTPRTPGLLWAPAPWAPLRTSHPHFLHLPSPVRPSRARLALPPPHPCPAPAGGPSPALVTLAALHLSPSWL